MLTVDDLHATYGKVAALRGVSFDVPAGSVTAVLGPNGAGKTTLVRCLAGVHPHRGEVRVVDRPLAPGRTRDRVRAGVVAVSERRDLVPSLTVDRYLGLLLDRAGRDEAYAQFAPLRGLARRRCGLLSGGEAQMLALARALASGPRVLLLDEISQGLAPAIVAEMVPAIRRAAEGGAAVVLVEQFVHLALGVADAAVLLASGEVHWQGPAADAPVDSVYLAAGA